MIVFTTIQQGYSQNNDSQLLVRSTVGVSGSSSTVSVDNKTYTIQQSIGQASVIGTFKTNNYTLRQGFIQPNILTKIKDTNIPLNLSAIVFPNPFVENISLSFNENIKGEVIISLYDLLGRMLFTNKYEANKNINIPLKELPVAHYILKVRANNRQFIKKIIKK